MASKVPDHGENSIVRTDGGVGTQQSGGGFGGNFLLIILMIILMQSQGSD